MKVKRNKTYVTTYKLFMKIKKQYNPNIYVYTT